MRRTAVMLVMAGALGATGVGSTWADHVTGGFCDGGIPGDERLGLRSFPRGDVFCPLIADPKADGSFLSYLRGTSSSAFGTDVGALGVGDRLGLFRWNGPSLGEGVQLSLTGNIYAQFDLNTSSSELINADYIVGLPLTIRRGPFSSRLRVYHQSSHLGDEFVLRSPVQRENFGFQAAEAIVSMDYGPFRAYAGGEYLFARDPSSLETQVAHGGVELRSGPTTPLNRIGLIAAVDVKSAEELNWEVSWSGRAGIEFGSAPGAEHLSRKWSLLAEYYTGPSPYGQFFRDEVSYYGLGLHVGP